MVSGLEDPSRKFNIQLTGILERERENEGEETIQEIM